MTTVSTSAFYERSNLQLSALRKSAEKLQSQIGTGQRLERSSDDPVAAARLRLLDRRAALSQVDAGNSDRAETNLNFAENAVAEMANLVVRARELAGQASSTTLSDTQRVTLGEELEAIRDSLVSLANSRGALGNPLFGGMAEGVAYAASGTGATYQGTAQAATVNLGDGQTVVDGLPGPELFEFTHNAATRDLFSTLGDLAAALKTGAPSSATAARDTLGAIDAGLDKLTTAQTVIGTRLAWIETVAERRTQRSELEADEQASVGGADLAASITRLQQTMTILEASQASFVKLANLSLFDILR